MLDYDLSVLDASRSEIIFTDKINNNKEYTGTPEIYFFEICDDNEVIKKIKILDEEFDIYSDGENIILTHPQWSLSGIGISLLEAERNLYEEAKSILPHYSKPNSQLTEDAINLKEFLNRLV